MLRVSLDFHFFKRESFDLWAGPTVAFIDWSQENLQRGVEKGDRCGVDQMANRVRERGDRFSELVLAIVASEPFQKRGASPAGNSQ